MERERETAWCLHRNLLSWLVFLESQNTMFRSTNQSASDEDPCADPESYVRGCPLCNSEKVFAFFFRREDPNITKIGSSSARQQNAI